MPDTTSAILAAAFLEVAAILLAAGLACWGVVRQIRAQRNLTKQNNSINTLMLLRRDDDLLQALGVAAEIHNNPRDDVKFYAYRDIPDDEDKSEWSKKVRALGLLVNYFETVSVGVNSGIYDWKIVYDNERAMFVSIHKWTEKFIQEVRARHERAENFGKHFEHVANQFSKDNLKIFVPLQ